MERTDKLDLFHVLRLRLLILIPARLLEEALDVTTWSIKYKFGIKVVWPWCQPSFISLKENWAPKRCPKVGQDTPAAYNHNAKVPTSAERRGGVIEVTGKEFRRVRNSFSKSENTLPIIGYSVPF